MSEPFQQLIRRARESVTAALTDRDLEGYLCALILRGSVHPWVRDGIDQIYSAPAPTTTRQIDIAVMGARQALGLDIPDSGALEALLKRELSRQPLPPAVRAVDDDRLLLGVSAGASKYPGLTQAMLTVLTQSGDQPRRAALSDWIRCFAANTLDNASLRSALRSVTATGSGFKDSVAQLWLASQLLTLLEWKPDDDDLSAIDAAIRHHQKVVLLDAPDVISPLDAAMLLEGIAGIPAHHLARRSVTEGVLEVFDAFPASVQILEKDRYGGRANLTLVDEHDVQWVLHALLVHLISDLVREDPAGKLANVSSRLDFTSKSTRMGIELKHIRKESHVSKAREEIMLDERQYQQFPYVDTVLVLVYDPKGLMPLANRTSFENDLSVVITVDRRTVRYITRVR